MAIAGRYTSVTPNLAGSAIDYREAPNLPAFRHCALQGRFHELADGPDMIRNPKMHRGRDPQGAVNAA
jgi:hypothetical protein